MTKNYIKKTFTLLFFLLTVACSHKTPELPEPPVPPTPPVVVEEDTKIYYPYTYKLEKDSVTPDGKQQVLLFSSETRYYSVLEQPYYIGQILSNTDKEESKITDKWGQNPLMALPTDFTLFDPARYPAKIPAGDISAIKVLYSEVLKTISGKQSVSFGYTIREFNSLRQLYMLYMHKVKELDKTVTGKKYNEQKNDLSKGFVYELEQELGGIMLDYDQDNLLKIPVNHIAVNQVIFGRDALLVFQTNLNKQDANVIIQKLTNNEVLNDAEKKLFDKSILSYVDPSKGLVQQGAASIQKMREIFSQKESIRPLKLKAAIGTADGGFQLGGNAFLQKVVLKK